MKKNAKKILVVHRSDGVEKYGGDISLLQAFGRELSKKYLVSEYYGVPPRHIISDFDAVLGCNLDRPVQACLTLRRCKQESVKFIFYTLHHPHDGIEAYLKQGVSGWKRLVARVARYSPVIYEEFLWVLRVFFSLLRYRTFIGFVPVKRAQIELLQHADALLVSSQLEHSQIEKDMAVPLRSHVVAHVDDSLPRKRCPVDNRILVPGRIECRKNQILILDVARKFPNFEFVFVGVGTKSEPEYVNEFNRILSLSDNCRSINGLEKEAFYDLLATSYFVVTASWFEVTSLIELYCLNNGIPLVCSKYSYLNGKGAVVKCDPSSSDFLASGILDMLDILKFCNVAVNAEQAEKKLADIIGEVL
ncbi:hypothetical protein [Zhongshania arctica]|uniref:Glycosyl transferase family 1 domain-containing protein n=1 Tax=Zhongshania arctica TaxID=3238302 RepID=A0ABV3TS20_9GAMM